MSIAEEVLNALPKTEDKAMSAAELFKLCTGTDEVKNISTALSQLYAAKQISRKVQIQGQARYVYWNAIPVEEPPADVAPVPIALAQSPSVPPAQAISLAGIVNQALMHTIETQQAEARVISLIEKEADIAKRLLAYQDQKPEATTLTPAQPPVNEADQFTKADAELLDELIKQNPLDVQIGGDHYKKLGDYQPWEVLKRWLTPEEFRGYMKGTAIAYLARERDKGGDMDIEKSKHTLEGLLNLQVKVAA